MQDLTVTLIQSELIWEDIDANLAAFDHKIDAIKEETDLIILPEMFTTGFTMNAQVLAQDMDGSAVNWIREKSRKKAVDLVGSMIIREHDKYYNRLLWAKPGGEMYWYDKRHLFRMLGEDKVYTPGNTHLTVELRNWKIRPFICYDLRFPAWTRNLNNQYDLAIFIANWPSARAEHWNLLLQARAIENQCYVIGLNRIGEDDNGLLFRGDSSIIDPVGHILFLKHKKAYIYTTPLSLSVLREYRNDFPAWKDADHDLFR